MDGTISSSDRACLLLHELQAAMAPASTRRSPSRTLPRAPRIAEPIEDVALIARLSGRAPYAGS
jgi:hypothetical protein